MITQLTAEEIMNLPKIKHFGMVILVLGRKLLDVPAF